MSANKLTPEHELLCDAAAMVAHLDKYSRNEQRSLLNRVVTHLQTVVETQGQESKLREQLEKANERAHDAEGVADLALKHRDLAEQQLVSARSDAIKECASLAQRWATDAAEFSDSDRCRVQHNVCRNMAVAIGNLAKTDEKST